ncbi:hypothetical protein Btru_065493 [Bulinus truncatus]|nr:hypothetical protein Btru_065493 [Bulinus truncatus]
MVMMNESIDANQEVDKDCGVSESQIISDGERQIYEVVTLVFITSAIGLFGLVSNIINVIVFVKMGLNNTVNIGFMGLAICDLLSLVTIEWYCLCFNPLFISSNINFFPPDVQHLSGGHPHGCFARITAWVTAYITFERCLCIIAPLKVKQILTPRRTIIILILIYFIVMLPLIPEYVTAYVGLKHFPHLNKTMYGLVFTSDRPKVNDLSFLLYAILMFASFLAVILLTTLLVVKLNEKSQWRQKSTFDNNKSDSLSKRDKAAIKTVILIASVLIVNFTPTVIFYTCVFVVPEFSIVGLQRNMFLVSAAFCFIFDTLNSSVTIIFYYTMTSKYRQCFKDLFIFCGQEKEIVISEETRLLVDIFNLIMIGFIASTVSLLGIFGNIINIVVFVKLGLRTSVNISFLSLAVSDLCNLVTTAWFCVCVNPYLNYDTSLVIFPTEVQHLTAGFPHACFARITAWTTVFMTAERCLCITFPFRIRQIITPRRTALAMVVIYLVVILAMIPEYLYVRLDWKYDSETNASRLGLVFSKDRTNLEGLSFLLYSVLMLTSFPTIVCFTTVLILKLKQNTEWRSQTNKNSSQTESLSRRDKSAIVTVMVVSSVFICTFTPTLLFSILGFAIPGFSVHGQYKDMFFILSYVAFALDATNASINIILYYVTNSSYRQTFHRVMSTRPDGT